MNREATTRFPFVDPEALGKAAVVCHRNADADSYLSAYAVSFLIRKLSPRCEVVVATPGGMTALTVKLSRRFGHVTAEEPAGEYDLMVAVDVGDTELLGSWKEAMKKTKGVKVLIDHHPLRDDGLYDRLVVDEGATSAAEVVHRLIRESGVQLDGTVAQALLEGLLFDSSHLSIASPGGLRAAVELMDAGADLVAARKELRSEPDYGEVLAKLKGAQRLKIYRVGDWVAATSMIGSFQAHVARSLVYLGADVAVVGGETEGETRVSLRATQRFAEKTGVQLGVQVAEAAAKEVGGHGGGHSTAASFSTEVGEEEAVASALAKVASLLGADLKDVD
ncbi:MAG TPA: DHH family phosphoesterase [Nitrososphaerales archaeon]|nr:DHH family phosphoesterase [Nitrososphaerales archaeon]